MCCVVENYQEEDGVRVRSCRLQAIGIWPCWACVCMSNFQVQFWIDIATCHVAVWGATCVGAIPPGTGHLLNLWKKFLNDPFPISVTIALGAGVLPLCEDVEGRTTSSQKQGWGHLPFKNKVIPSHAHMGSQICTWISLLLEGKEPKA